MGSIYRDQWVVGPDGRGSLQSVYVGEAPGGGPTFSGPVKPLVIPGAPSRPIPDQPLGGGGILPETPSGQPFSPGGALRQALTNQSGTPAAAGGAAEVAAGGAAGGAGGAGMGGGAGTSNPLAPFQPPTGVVLGGAGGVPRGAIPEVSYPPLRRNQPEVPTGSDLRATLMRQMRRRLAAGGSGGDYGDSYGDSYGVREARRPVLAPIGGIQDILYRQAG